MRKELLFMLLIFLISIVSAQFYTPIIKGEIILHVYNVEEGDETDPVVNLIAPADETSGATQTHSFNATFTDNVQLDNSTFNLWNSTGDNINQTTITITGTSNSTNLTVQLPYVDVFEWNYEACDNSSNCAFNAANYTITYSVDTCSCPGLDQNWEIDMSDYCNITSDCNLGTGTLSFTGTGNARINATINSTDLGDPGADGILYILKDGLINVFNLALGLMNIFSFTWILII